MRTIHVTIVVHCAFALCFSLTDSAHGGKILWDDVLRSIDLAGKHLTDGQGRKQVLAELEEVAAANPQSRYWNRAQRLIKDLRLSIKVTDKLSFDPDAIRREPYLYLVETRTPLHLIAIRENAKHLTLHAAQHRDDPVSRLIENGRPMIEFLIESLGDHSVTRSYDTLSAGIKSPRIARVCDVAMELIEHLSLCPFHDNASTGLYLHEESEDTRTAVIADIRAWWEVNKNKSPAQGIRARLATERLYQVQLADALIRLADNSDDVANGKKVLMHWVESRRGGESAGAALKLAGHGDFRPLGVFYNRWKESLNEPVFIYDGYLVYYMCRYGGRREWELMTEIAQGEINKGILEGYGRMWPAMMSSNYADTSPWAVPLLGVALSQTKVIGSEWINMGKLVKASFSYADSAAEYLQEQTGEDFGYRRNASAEQRSAAIRKAQQWWEKTGREAYTFDRIEQRIQRESEVKGSKCGTKNCRASRPSGSASQF